MTASKKTRKTIPSYKETKAKGEKVTMITVYDYPMARLVDQTSAEMILVGDSLGMSSRPLPHQPGHPGGGQSTTPRRCAAAPPTRWWWATCLLSYQVNPDQASCPPAASSRKPQWTA